jgi:putative membrane protein
MKNINSAIITILTICSLQSCNSGVQNKFKPDTEADTDVMSTTPDTSSTLNLAVDKDDSAFAVEAANCNLTEMMLGKLAITKGKSKKVKNFGALMIKDHSKANTKLEAIAKDKKIILPIAPDTGAQKMREVLAQKYGNQFDDTYIKMMMDDHEKDAKLFYDASKKIQDPELKTFAVKTLPVLQNHLDAINAIHDSMKH